MFQDTLERLLLPELSRDERLLYFSPMTEGVENEKFWTSAELDGKLQSQLGSRYEVFMDAATKVRQVLEKLMDKLDIDSHGKA